MHQIGFYVCNGHDALDLAGPLTAFGQLALAAGHTQYELHVISCAGGKVIGNSGLPLETKPFNDRVFDTVIFVGGDVEPMYTPQNISAASQLVANASRVACVCTGVFLLGETGMLICLQN